MLLFILVECIDLVIDFWFSFLFCAITEYFVAVATDNLLRRDIF